MPKLAHILNILLLTISALIASPSRSLAQKDYSPSFYGMVGLNTIPTARMDKVGTTRLSVSTLDPYLNTTLGTQLSDSLYVQLRQSAEISGISDNAKRLYSGIDFKLRLLTEKQFRPEISIGVIAAIGHTRMSGEYLALSKAYKSFDFTAGIGWGRLGSKSNISNPLTPINSHFDRGRNLSNENPSRIENWFTGNDVGLFAGFEYFTPIKGLSIKADYSADNYSAEHSDRSFQRPQLWSLGLNYQPLSWLNAGLATQGTDKIMGRVTFKTNLKNIPTIAQNNTSNKTKLRSYRTELALNNQIELSAQKENIILNNTNFKDNNTTDTSLILNPICSTPHQIGQAAKHMSNHSGPIVNTLSIDLHYAGLKGPTVTFLRDDLIKANALKTGSAEEIWRNAEVDTNNTNSNKPLIQNRENATSLELEQQISLSEEDSGVLARTSVMLGFKNTNILNLFDQETKLRINIHDNLNRLTDIRPRSTQPVRSDVDIFANRTLTLEQSTLSYTKSFTPDLHLALAGGYLEEMYAGAGGEILYRPFGKRYAFGAQGWQVFKRDPLTTFSAGLTTDHVLTGHVKAWYDLPKRDLTLSTKFGRYLAEDIGATLGLIKRFENGVRLEGTLTLTDARDTNLFGDQTHINHGIALIVPFANYKHLPKNSKATLRLAPFGRDIGETINAPTQLYERTEPLSYSHITRHWNDITEE